jgi:hypothetical protein
MAAIKEISKYYSEDELRVATVFKNLDNLTYHVSVMSDAGTSFRAEFDHVDAAENFAEDWVMKK